MCDLDLLVLAVGYEPVVVHKPLDGVWEQGPGWPSGKTLGIKTIIPVLWVPIEIESESVQDFLS